MSAGPASPQETPRAWRAALPHVVLLALAFAGLMAWTWGTWPDPMVDFGRELYVPWRMSEGAALQRDLAWFNGPLSPHVNATLFRVFGVGLTTLVWANALVFALTLALLHQILRACASAWAATFACLVVLATCGFGQQVGIGNYNQLCPYSHEATHGLCLALASVALLSSWKGRGSIVLVLAAGFCTGLAFLTKPEPFVAGFAGSVASLVALSWSARFRLARAATAWAFGLVSAVLLGWTLQVPELGTDLAWRSTLGAWPDVANGEVAKLPFYKAGMGTDAPGRNLMRLGLVAFGLVGALLPGLALARFAARRFGERPTALVAALVTAGIAAACWSVVPWQEIARPWPLFAAVATLLAVLATRAHRGLARWPALAGFALLSLALLAKVALNARIAQYGFTLALPATALIAAAVWSWIPAWISRTGGSGLVARASGTIVVATIALSCLATTQKIHARKDVELGHGHDKIRTDVRGRVMTAALEWLARQPAPEGRPLTVAVLPEGVTLNYLARVTNPTPYVNFMPPELIVFGEERIVESFRAAPPDIVFLAHKNTSEYGVPWFGRDYGQKLFGWLTSEYRPVALFGDPPLGLQLPGEPPLQRAPVFGIRAFVRNRQ